MDGWVVWGHLITDIRFAAKHRYDDIFDRLLEAMPEDSKKTCIACLLNEAIISNDKHIVGRLLADQRCSPNQFKEAGLSPPIHSALALHYGDTHVTKMLCQHPKFDVNATYDVSGRKRTPLMDAVEQFSIDRIRVLLKCQQIDVNFEVLNETGKETALTWAVTGGQKYKAIVSLLLQDDRIDARSSVKILIDLGEELRHRGVFSLLLENEHVDVNVGNYGKGTLLHDAIKMRSTTAIIDILKRSELTRTAKDSKGRTAFEFAKQRRRWLSKEANRVLEMDEHYPKSGCQIM